MKNTMIKSEKKIIKNNQIEDKLQNQSFWRKDLSMLQ